MLIALYAMFILSSLSQPSSLSAKLSELASRRADWLSSMTISHHEHQQQQQRKSCPSLETVIGGSEADGRGSVEQGSSLQRSSSSSCLSSPLVESIADVSVCLQQAVCSQHSVCFYKKINTNQ